MALDEGVQAAREHAEAIAAGLDEAAREEFEGLWRRLTEAEEADDPSARDAAKLALAGFLAGRLPRSHPVRRAFAADTGTMGGSATTAARLDAADLRRLLAALTALPDAAGPNVPVGDRPGDAAYGSAEVSAPVDPAVLTLARAAHAALLAHPSLTAAQVRAAGADPDAPRLIRLTDPGGEARLPAFQFGADGRPLDVVVTINGLLGADDDPWGVASWWLDPHAWLRAAPAARLAGIPANELIALATAELEEE